MHIDFNPKGHAAFRESHLVLIGMDNNLWKDCVKLVSKSPSWPFGSMATKHHALGYCQVGGSLCQRHFSRCGGRQIRTAARSIAMGRFYSDASGSLARHQPYSALHGKDVQHQQENETLLAHLSVHDLRWHEYGVVVLLLGLSKYIYI